jgi:hypothetical protein
MTNRKTYQLTFRELEPDEFIMAGDYMSYDNGFSFKSIQHNMSGHKPKDFTKYTFWRVESIK